MRRSISSVSQILTIALAAGRTLECEERCQRFPKLCDDVEYCIERCGAHASHVSHCGQLKSFNDRAREARSREVPQDVGRAMAGSGEDWTSMDPHQRTVIMHKIMAGDGSGPHVAEL
eukprot:TRINITY_DN31729_c0_g1_i1.p1 TRINITY_DN31729_c0_g1~~TRINITY_DN31729_c0_g1_i1.p1  ORF type:complete len:132 (-),score=16.91 TRINITY_DN31729_c0_g1_i1:93-443(-)